jgi:pimeloyl-ACP methyl ester carboxylesterase
MAETTVNGIRLVHETRGEGPSVLLVCGTGQPATVWWLTLAQQLVDLGYQVTTFDNRGIAPSDVPPPPYTVSAMADDTIGLIEALGRGPYVVMGASLGGLITQTVALRRPDLVRGVVLLVGCGNFSLYGRVMLQGEVEARRMGVELPRVLFQLRTMELMIPPDSRGDDDVMTAILAFADLLGSGDPDGLHGQIEADYAWAQEDHVAELTDLAVPALAVAHQHDPLFPPALVAKAVAAMPDAELVVVPGANHVFMERTDAVDEALTKFLARTS